MSAMSGRFLLLAPGPPERVPEADVQASDTETEHEPLEQYRENVSGKVSQSAS